MVHNVNPGQQTHKTENMYEKLKCSNLRINLMIKPISNTLDFV